MKLDTNLKQTTQTFVEYVDKALEAIDDERFVGVLQSGIRNNTDRLNRYCDTYAFITSRKWSVDSLCTFFCGWRSPDGAAHAVSSIIVRILQASEVNADTGARIKLLDAARHCGEIIVEDIGLGELHGHPHHSKLYHRMASAICGSDNWRLQDRFLDPVTREFSTWVGQKRPLAEDLTEAIEMMLMTELFNTGEYNLMTPLWKNWIREQFGYTTTQVNNVASFLSVHCGAVEAMHFSHAARVLQLYADATGQDLHYERIEALSNEYVIRACAHLDNMASVLKH